MSDTAICVAIRSRPLLRNETQSSDTLSFGRDSTVTLQKKTYTFDYVFPPGVSNEAVYNTVVAEKIRPIFEGYNVTILAYGPTGSGKTYTMGTDYNPRNTSHSDIGIIPRGITEIFRVVESQQETIDFLIKVSFLELYREEIFDLLQKSPTPCNLRDDGDSVKVANLTEIAVQSMADAFITLEKGSTLRHTSATAKNLKSSRSHAIFSVHVEQTDKITKNFKRSKFQLVDLAGSERMSSSKTAGLQVKEGININLGLLSLGKVITHLIEEKQHVPYRDSKLTRLLQDSLGGNSHTVMIACVNPSSNSTEETLSTLRYASNTRRIKNRPVVNVDPPAVQIEKLKKQVEALQAALYEFQSASGSAGIVPSSAAGKKFPKVEELELHLQQSYSKISSLNHRLYLVDDKYSQILDGIDSLYKKIMVFMNELTAAAETDPSLQNHLARLEEVYQMCLKLVDSNLSQTSLDGDSSPQPEEKHPDVLDESGDSINKSQEPELQLRTLSDITNKQKIRSDNLENISRTLSMKVGQIKNIEAFIRNYDTTVNEDYLNSLIIQIQSLTEEKTNLQESMKVAEDKVRSETQEKIEKYEQQILNLQNELRKKTVVFQVKTENQAKVNQLQKEIIDLKKHKVQLVRQMKEDSNKFLQKQKEKEREVAKLVREGRKKEHELVKMKIKFDNEVKVLKQKIDRVTATKNKDLARKRSTYIVKEKTKSSLFQEIDEWINEELNIRIDDGIAKIECEMLEKEAQSLKQQIDNIEKFTEENPNEEANLKGYDVNSLKSVFQILVEKVETFRSLVKDGKTKDCPILDGLSSMSQAKSAVEALFKKCVSAEVEGGRQRMIFQEQLKKEQLNNELNEEKIKNLNREINNLNENFASLKLEQEEKVTALKYEYDTKVMHLLTEIQFANKSSLTSNADPNLAERVEIQANEISKLQHIMQSYEEKCKEANMLQQQLFQAKKGKKPTWLGNLSRVPSATHSSTSLDEGEKSTSMLEAFLSDSADESFGYDKTDPDWRLTPAYKELRAKHARKRRRAEAGSLNADDSDSSSSKKKSLMGCQCRTDCHSNRCRCKKRNTQCTELCGCIKEACLNTGEGSGDSKNEEVKKLSFND
ncbi:chromosome-associated kinesin KIF4 [Caerostris darwini]|uniref:Chromosome-associated kinesin KIF4 n=1 Tax=Caerostris darwini TaxID=1538125 RepID=A0AAV4PH88_9ARAC|nr:chromosome-associated kinesin KIF4 [Caerostris darwini]